MGLRAGPSLPKSKGGTAQFNLFVFSFKNLYLHHHNFYSLEIMSISTLV